MITVKPGSGDGVPVGGAAATIDGNPAIDADLGGALGVIPIFPDNGRTVLAISSNGGSDHSTAVSTTLLRSRVDGASISGDVVATDANADTVNLSANLGVQQQLAAVTSLFEAGPGAYGQSYRGVGYDDGLVARYLDRKNLPLGSVLMDTSTSWLIWWASDNPKQVVIASDFDFTVALNRPRDMGVKYFVVSNRRLSAANAIQRRHPSMWADREGSGAQAEGSAGEPIGQVPR